MMHNNIRVQFTGKAERRFVQKKPRDMWLVISDDICREIGEYIASHESAGIRFDSIYQEIIYDERMVFMLRKENGCWQIVDVIVRLPVSEFLPVFIWKKIRRGATEIVAKFIGRWRIVRCTQQAAA